jgi:hypothetical protein
MERVRVQHGEVSRTTRNTSPDQPMRWAKVKTSPEVTYIGWLRPEQNGDACGCECPACGAALQAVNVDKDASHFAKTNSRGQFFRHLSGHQRNDCSFLMAKLAALHLLMERNEIDLPAPRRRATYEGASGATYTEEAIGCSWRGYAKNKVWLDNQSATIEVGGRKILLQLQARPGLSASDLGVDGVITIRVDDPIVASWEPEQILQALQLDNGFTCWEKHWDDANLDAEARQKAIALAEQALDHIPAELGSLDGQSFLQKSETVLHAKVKEILLHAGRLRVPPCEEHVTRIMCDGNHRSIKVGIDSQSLVLTDVRLETPLQGVVPDVMCIATSTRNPSTSFPLLIEVAVTHRVDAYKKSLIEKLGLACVEIDLTKLDLPSRRITIERLTSTVIDNIECKRWVFNPALAQIAKSKKVQLAAEDEEMHKFLEHEDERQQWLDGLSTERLLELLIPTLRHYWATGGAWSVEDAYEVTHEEITIRLKSRGFPDAEDPVLSTKDGLLDCLARIRTRQYSERAFCELDEVLWMDQSQPLRKYITLGLMAIKYYPSNCTPSTRERLNDLRKKVECSLKNENYTYARPDTHDRLITLLFPPMSEAIQKGGFGTISDLKKNIASRHFAMQEAAMAKARELQLEREKSDLMLEEQTRRQQRINSLLQREKAFSWKMESSGRTIETVLREANVARSIRNYSRAGLDVADLLRSAWEARASNYSIHFWFGKQPEAKPEVEKLMIEALRTASLI